MSRPCSLLFVEWGRHSWRPGGRIRVFGVWRGHNETNWAIIHHLAVELQMMGRPFLIGGDFQQSPAELAAEGVFDVLRGVEVITAQGEEGTCNTRGVWSNIDFFLISRELVPKVISCQVELDAAIRPHRPVSVKLRRGGALPLERIMVAPLPFPVDRPVGPVPPIQVDWEEVKDIGSKEDLDEAVAHWFGNAEKVMANLCMMSDVGKFGGRGHSARFKWTRPNVRQMLGRARVSSAARSWFWLADRLGELAVLVERPPAKCWAHRCGLVGKLRAPGCLPGARWA